MANFCCCRAVFLPLSLSLSLCYLLPPPLSHSHLLLSVVYSGVLYTLSHGGKTCSTRTLSFPLTLPPLAADRHNKTRCAALRLNIGASVCCGTCECVHMWKRKERLDALEVCAAEQQEQLREQECALLIMWTGHYHSLVIGSQGLHQSHKVSPRQ